MKILKYLFFLIGFVLLSSCNSDEVCTENIDKTANIKFVQISVVDDVITENELSLNNLIVFPIERAEDSIYNFQNGVANISLPLNPNSTQTAFAIKADEIQDTLYFHHQSEMKYVSLICGFTWFFSLEDVTHTGHAIDSVIVTDSIIDLDERINYKIYYR